jgi:hypothetical protein
MRTCLVPLTKLPKGRLALLDLMIAIASKPDADVLKELESMKERLLDEAFGKEDAA